MAVVTEYVSGNIFIRPMMKRAERGYVVEGHAHNFDHTTFVISGSVECTREWPDGTKETGIFEAGDHLLIKAECKHGFVALENNTTAYCIYAHRRPNGEVVQHYNGWHPAYG